MAIQKKWLMIGVGVWGLLSIVSSFGHSNPPITQKVNWDSPKTEALFNRVCADCHSHQTNWPWYSYVAPVSFVINHHVNEGREHFNISAGVLDEAHEAAEEYEEGEMPEGGYVNFHPEANLSPEEKAQLIAGLKATFGDGHGHGHGDDHDHDHGDGHQH